MQIHWFLASGISLRENTRNFLDVIYEGWCNPSYSKLDITTWVQQLKDNLDALRDSALFNNHISRLKQNTHKPNARAIGTYKPGDLVFTRIPGCRATLQASWEGPFRVNKYIPPINYEIEDIDKTWSKVTHINNLRKYQELPRPKSLSVQAACLVAEESIELSRVLTKVPSLAGNPCEGYSQQELDAILSTYGDVFSPTPGGQGSLFPYQATRRCDSIQQTPIPGTNTPEGGSQ